MGFLNAMESGHFLDLVLASKPEDWKVIPSGRWLEAEHRNYPKLGLRP